MVRIVAGAAGSGTPTPTMTPGIASTATLAAAGTVPPVTPVAEAPAPPPPSGQRQHFLVSVGDIPEEAASETIVKLVGKHSMWAFGQNTPNRTKVRPGDRLAFYQAATGVVATAEVASAPEDKPMPGIVKDPTKYRWTFALKETQLFLDRPVVIDAATRLQLDAFAGKDPSTVWSWFVFATRLISEHDYALLTGAA